MAYSNEIDPRRLYDRQSRDDTEISPRRLYDRQMNARQMRRQQRIDARPPREIPPRLARRQVRIDARDPREAAMRPIQRRPEMRPDIQLDDPVNPLVEQMGQPDNQLMNAYRQVMDGRPGVPVARGNMGMPMARPAIAAGIQGIPAEDSRRLSPLMQAYLQRMGRVG